jgi:hypothetical protein
MIFRVQILRFAQNDKSNWVGFYVTLHSFYT